MSSKVERALTKLTKVVATTSDELTACFGQADLLPPAIGKELAAVVEGIDYLGYLLHALILENAVCGERPARQPGGQGRGWRPVRSSIQCSLTRSIPITSTASMRRNRHCLTGPV